MKCPLCNRNIYAKGLCKKHYEIQRLTKRKKEIHLAKLAKLEKLQELLTQKIEPKTKEGMWLQGFADGEGSISLPITKTGGHASRVIALHNTDSALIKKACQYLDKLGIDYHVKTRIMINKKPIQIIFISHQENFIKWYQKISFTSPKKLYRLKENIKNYNRAKFSWNNKKQLKTIELRKQNYTYYKIGKMLGCSEHTIWTFFKKYISPT